MVIGRANAIDGNQSVYLNELIDDGNGEVRKVFLAYEKDKDVYKLIASLKTHNKPVLSLFFDSSCVLISDYVYDV